MTRGFGLEGAAGEIAVECSHNDIAWQGCKICCKKALQKSFFLQDNLQMGEEEGERAVTAPKASRPHFSSSWLEGDDNRLRRVVLLRQLVSASPNPLTQTGKHGVKEAWAAVLGPVNRSSSFKVLHAPLTERTARFDPPSSFEQAGKACGPAFLTCNIKASGLLLCVCRCRSWVTSAIESRKAFAARQQRLSGAAEPPPKEDEQLLDDLVAIVSSSETMAEENDKKRKV